MHKIIKLLFAFIIPITALGDGYAHAANPCLEPTIKIASNAETIAQQLGWVQSDENRCGGYYTEAPFSYPDALLQKRLIQYTNDGPTLFSLHGTSVLQGKITITQSGQQITASKASLYRNPNTGKLNAVDLSGNIHLREPDSLVLAQTGHLNFETKEQSLKNILYRTAIYGNTKSKPQAPDNAALQQTRKITQLSAWGEASEFAKNQPKIYHLREATYSTCPPTTNTWHVKASHIELDKNTGRGVATNARLYIQKIPVFYTPYFNFPIDDRRKTGFLYPFFGTDSKSGPFIGTPFYWNAAPNYDSTIIPKFLAKRGLQVNDVSRYLTPSSHGQTIVSIIPYDRAFSDYQLASQEKYQGIQNSTVQANLNRLENAGTTRGALAWLHNSRLNEHWSNNVDFNYVTDDYYLQDFGHNLNETSENQLLEQADINYRGQNWNFTGRVEQYQTLHPVDSVVPFQNQYMRLPQLVLEGNYPDQKFGLNYFISNEATHFNIRKMPGSDAAAPIGSRLHTQPGVSLPLNWPFFYVAPRIQTSLTEYNLGNVSSLMQSQSQRTIPIFDVASELYFDRNMTFFGYALRQTLEPQAYYVYIPYHNQNQIPLFDTVENTLSYDQLFTYNRFSGLDRIGDANQVSLGVTTHFFDADTGLERIRAGVGQIIYFANRLVTECTVDNPNCASATTLNNNQQRRSPIAGVIDYHLNPFWQLTSNTIWNLHKNEVNNQTVGLQYRPDPKRVINLGYNFARNGDIQPGLAPGSSGNNLKQMNISFAWPVITNWSAIGEWTQSINQDRFQNLLYGLQYDSCCWAVRLVGGRSFVNLNPNGAPTYDTKVFIQFALRGLANVGSADPSQLLSSSVNGYNTSFGQDF